LNVDRKREKLIRLLVCYSFIILGFNEGSRVYSYSRTSSL